MIVNVLGGEVLRELGIHQGSGLSVTVPELIGPLHASLVLLTARRFGGEEATRLRMADVRVAADQVRGICAMG